VYAVDILSCALESPHGESGSRGRHVVQ